jgi:hypothetical protein
MFPAGRQLPFLQVLTINPIVDWRTDFGTGEEWCFDGTDIHSIVTCCTALKELDISHSVQPGGEVYLYWCTVAASFGVRPSHTCVDKLCTLYWHREHMRTNMCVKAFIHRTANAQVASVRERLLSSCDCGTAVRHWQFWRCPAVAGLVAGWTGAGVRH